MKKVLSIILILILISSVPFSSYAKATKQTAEGYYKIAAGLSSSGKYQEAIKNYDLALKINAKYFLAYLGKGNALSYMEKYKEAIACFDKAIQINSKDPQSYFFKGKVLNIQKKYVDAVKSFDLAIKLNYKNADLYYEKGYALIMINKTSEALAAFDKALEINQKHTQAYLNKADILYNQGLYEDSIKLYDIVISLDSSNSYACYSKGAALYFLEKYSDSIKAYDKALSINPNYESAYVNKADSLNRLGRYDEAVKCLEKARQLDSTDYDIEISMGNTYYFQKIYDEAVKYYSRALELNPSALNALVGKGFSSYYLSKYNESIDALNKALAIEPGDAETNYYMCLSTIKGGDLKNYITYLQKAISLDSSYMLTARSEEAFKVVSNDDLFVQTVYDATESLDDKFINSEILKISALSGTKFLDITTLGNASDDGILFSNCKVLLDNLYSGNIYNITSADTYHISKDSPIRSDLVSIGRSIKGQSLVGLKTTYELNGQSIAYIGKKSGSVNSAILKLNIKVKFDGSTTTIESWYVFVKNNGVWDFYGFLNIKDSTADN